MGVLFNLLLHGEPCLDVQQDGHVDCLLYAVPRHSVHLGAKLPSGQRLTQGCHLLHELLRHVGLVRLLLHVGLLTTQACFYFFISFLRVSIAKYDSTRDPGIQGIEDLLSKGMIDLVSSSHKQ